MNFNNYYVHEGVFIGRNNQCKKIERCSWLDISPGSEIPATQITYGDTQGLLKYWSANINKLLASTGGAKCKDPPSRIVLFKGVIPITQFLCNGLSTYSIDGCKLIGAYRGCNDSCGGICILDGEGYISVFNGWQTSTNYATIGGWLIGRQVTKYISEQGRMEMPGVAPVSAKAIVSKDWRKTKKFVADPLGVWDGSIDLTARVNIKIPASSALALRMPYYADLSAKNTPVTIDTNINIGPLFKELNINLFKLLDDVDNLPNGWQKVHNGLIQKNLNGENISVFYDIFGIDITYTNTNLTIKENQYIRALGNTIANIPYNVTIVIEKL